ncbi:MAG: adenosine kinase [Candidatus Sericytochromatia bacterium]
MAGKDIKVLAICNVLKDIVVKVSDAELAELGLTKGIMHLVSPEDQQKILTRFENREKIVEMGGSGPNMMRTLAVLGQKVSQAGMVGSDLYGELYLNRVRELGIVNNIRQAQIGSTGTSIILISPDGERTMNTCLGMSRSYTTKDIPEADIARSEYLVVTGYQWDTDNQIEAINHAIRVAKRNQTKIVFDLSDPFCVSRHRETFLNILDEYVDIVIANRKEAEMLTGKDAEGSLDDLSALTEIAIVKCGSQGSWLKTKTEKVFIPCNPIQVTDSTAAGDMYAGGFLYGLLENLSLEASGHIANFCAETVIQQVGARIPDNLLELAQAYLKKVLPRTADLVQAKA